MINRLDWVVTLSLSFSSSYQPDLNLSLTSITSTRENGGSGMTFH